MVLKEATPAPGAVPTAAIAEHLRLSAGFDNDGAEDALLARLWGNAVAAVEARIGQALIARAFTLTVGSWDASGHVILPIGPVSAVTSLTFEGMGDPLAVDVAGLCLAPGLTGQRLTGANGGALPAISGARAVLTFTAGHGADWDAVPRDLYQAVMMLTARLYEDRSAAGGTATTHGLPEAVQALLAPHRPVRL